MPAWIVLDSIRDGCAGVEGMGDMFVPSSLHSFIQCQLSCALCGPGLGIVGAECGILPNPFPECAVGPWAGWGTCLDVCSSRYTPWVLICEVRLVTSIHASGTPVQPPFPIMTGLVSPSPPSAIPTCTSDVVQRVVAPLYVGPHLVFYSHVP